MDGRYWLRRQARWPPLLISLGGLLDSIPLLGLSFLVCNLGYLENIPEIPSGLDLLTLLARNLFPACDSPASGGLCMALSCLHILEEGGYGVRAAGGLNLVSGLCPGLGAMEWGQ